MRIGKRSATTRARNGTMSPTPNSSSRRNKHARGDGRHSLRQTLPGQAGQSSETLRCADPAHWSRALRFGGLPARRKNVRRACSLMSWRKIMRHPFQTASKWTAAKRQRGFYDGTRFHVHGRGRFPVGMADDLLLGNTYGIQTELFRHSRGAPLVFCAARRRSDTRFPIYAKNDPLRTTASYRQYRRRYRLQPRALQRIAALAMRLVH